MMEHTYSSDSHQHVDIAIRNNSSPGTSDTHIVLPVTSHLNGDRPSTSTHIPSSEPSLRPPRGLMSRNSSSVVRGGRYGSRSPLNSGLWISVELVVTLGQIIAAIVIMSLSRYESPEAPLFAWVVGYTCGCVATLPILYWRLRHCNRDQHSQSHHGSSGSIRSSETTFTSSSIARGSEEGHHDPGIASRNSHSRGRLSLRLNGMVDHLKITLDCFFAVWFVVGNVWIFGEHTPPSDAPKLYRLCIVFLAFSCIGYALPFVLCSTICCCLPCLISVLGIREDSFPTEGTNVEFIKALPTYKFKLRKTEDTDDQEIHSRTNEGGIIAGGTEKERIISGEDAACCICLATYVDDDELRELPCSHLFHVECVDEWLNVNASCPLCKINVGGSSITTSL